LKELIENGVRWSAIGKHSKTEYVYSIGRAVLEKESNTLTMDITLNFVIPFEDANRMEEDLSARFDPVRFRFRFHYEDVILTEKEILKQYIPYMVKEANGTWAHLTRTLDPDQFTVEGDTVKIQSLGKTITEQLNDKVAKLFSGYLKRDFAMDKKVLFYNSEEAYETVTREQERKAEEDMRQAAEEAARAKEAAKAAGRAPQEGGASANGSGAAPWQGSNGGGWKGGNGGGNRRASWKKFVPAEGNCLLGRPIKEANFNLGDLREDSGDVIVQGEILRMEGKNTKTGNVIAQIVIADTTGATCLKFFTIPEKWEELSGLLHSGDTIMAAGSPEFDPYEKDLVLRTLDISRGEKKVRKDECTEKRVELHMHTKMSQMDGLIDTKAAIKTLAGWGHKAAAITDHGVVMAFPDAMHVIEDKKWKYPDFKVIYGMEGYLLPDDDGPIEKKSDYRGRRTYHIILLAQTQAGLKNLYKMVSDSHLKHFYRKPLIPRSLLKELREGVIVGSACEAGEFFQAVFQGKSEEELLQLAEFYDYLEIQPLINDAFMIRDGLVSSEEDLRNINRRIVEIGKKAGKPVVATCDAHYMEPEEALYRRILMAGNGFKDAESGEGLYLRTTQEMLDEFAYLGEDIAHEVVIDAPNAIADRIERIRPVPKDNYPPKIDNAEQRLRDTCMRNAHALYGPNLPQLVADRLEAELSYVIDKGYAVMYVSAEMLVQKSLSDGYLVGSRGSVGSSFAATMAGITEVNPLPAHYICTNKDCWHTEFDKSGQYDCGVDMPDKPCPICGAPTIKTGYNIPFETFLGIAGADKEPDIDLNFAGEYQPSAHKYVEEIFGKENVYRAGTMTSVQDKTAYGYVKKYYEGKGENPGKWEMDYLAQKCTGVRRSTGQHPGGMVIVPRGHTIEEFCPVQHPPNEEETVTTHFEYHAIDKNLLKLDILGHEVPSIIRHLQDLTGVDPLTAPVGDPKVMSIFLNTEALGIKNPEYPFRHGTYGIPEFGTKFVRQMLDDTKPSHFADLVRISGFSHGTDVWLNNAQDLILEGIATMADAISTRDDIMNYLIAKGMPGKDAFKIMEKVRKGKGVTDEEAELMKQFGTPDWYIESCRRIQYMFPKAHAVAYVLMSYRIAYYKVYYPQAFYAASFSSKVADFNAEVILGGLDSIMKRMAEIQALGRDMTPVDEGELIVLELACEMLSRGYEFLPVDLEKSNATKFSVEDGKVRLSFQALPGVGETAAKNIAAAAKAGPFRSKEDLQSRAKISSKVVETLGAAGALTGLPEADQLSLF